MTHVVVHAELWPDDTGSQIQAWLEGSGAVRLVQVDRATVYAIRP